MSVKRRTYEVLGKPPDEPLANWLEKTVKDPFKGRRETLKSIPLKTRISVYWSVFLFAVKYPEIWFRDYALMIRSEKADLKPIPYHDGGRNVV